MTGRDRTVLAIVLVIGAIAGGWFLVVSPKRSQASKLGTQVQALQSQLDSVRSQVAQDEAARAAFPKNYTTIAKLGEAVPADDNVPSLIYELQNAASGARVSFQGIQLTSSGSSTTSASTPPAGTTSSTSQAVTATLPPGAAVGPAGFPTEPFTFTFQGSFFQLKNFFGRLERFVVASNKNVSISGRLMTLNAISLGPGAQGFPQISAAISATTYLLPAAQGLTNGATAGGPGGSTPISTTASSSPAAPAVVSSPVR